MVVLAGLFIFYLGLVRSQNRMSVDDVVLLPMKVDAFVLNDAVCSSPSYKIAPITQPNYTFLRLHDNLIEADILDHVDLHAPADPDLTSRITDLRSVRALNVIASAVLTCLIK